MIQKTKLKKIFNKMGVQLPIRTINQLDDDIKREFTKMAERCKNGNIKRLTTDLLYFVKGKWIR
jgi:23S rRNA maturation-related 3'-5' exoribonuclease YhaM